MHLGFWVDGGEETRRCLEPGFGSPQLLKSDEVVFLFTTHPLQLEGLFVLHSSFCYFGTWKKGQSNGINPPIAILFSNRKCPLPGDEMHEA